MERLIIELFELQKLEDGWDSYGSPAPSYESVHNLLTVLLDSNKLSGSKSVWPTPDGGVGFSVHNGDITADIICCNDQEIVVVATGGRGTLSYEEVFSRSAVDNAIKAINAYIVLSFLEDKLTNDEF